MLGGLCRRCGANQKLQFDHIDRATKAANVADMLTAALELFEAEVRKCQLLCKPCHRKKSLEAGDQQAAQHGLGLYSRGVCRCDICRAARHAKYLRCGNSLGLWRSWERVSMAWKRS